MTNINIHKCEMIISNFESLIGDNIIDKFPSYSKSQHSHTTNTMEVEVRKK